MKCLPKLPMSVYPLYDIFVRSMHLLQGSWYPLNRDENMTPFFIVGAGRSGTTLLRRILQAGGEVHIPPETYILDDVVRFYMRNCHMPWPYVVHHILMLFEFHPEFGVFKVSLRPLVLELVKAPKEKRSLAYILDQFYRFHGKESKQVFEKWGDKTPGNAFFMNEIYTVFPKARYIHMLRDGVDVVHSHIKNGLLQDYKVAAEKWKNAVSCAQDFERKHPELCLLLRYEDFVREPEKSVRSVCEFIGISYKKEMLSSMDHIGTMNDLNVYAHYKKTLQPISQDNIGIGRKEMNEEQKKIIQDIIGDKLKELNYAPVLSSHV